MSRKSDELKQAYLRWLEPQLKDGLSPNTKSYWELLLYMFEKPFGWLDNVPMDENRAVDGTDLRVEFAHTIRRDPQTLKELWGPCTFAEVLIGLSRRMAFVAGGTAPGWAWVLLGNLEMQRLSDPLTPAKKRVADEIMDRVIGRTYNEDGTGGFFPLAWPQEDQRAVELWYQLNSFVEELHPEH
jgi:hypothetical protein